VIGNGTYVLFNVFRYKQNRQLAGDSFFTNYIQKLYQQKNGSCFIGEKVITSLQDFDFLNLTIHLNQPSLF